jgi:hypothetical protein
VCPGWGPAGKVGLRVKLCAGGCGQPPPIAKRNDRRHGQEIEQIKMRWRPPGFWLANGAELRNP